MNLTIKKTKIVLYIFSFLGLILLLELFYLNLFNAPSDKGLTQKKAFVSLIGLPDLAIAQEPFVRHRTLSSVFEIYSVDATLREYTPSTFTISNRSERK